MKNEGRVYKITSAAIILLALFLIVLIAGIWYMFGYSYIVAPKAGSVITSI